MPGNLLPPGTAREDFTETDDEEEEESWQDLMPEIQDIERSIQELGGFVLPKLNWTAPRDATWIIPGESMKCANAPEILLLLKASDFVSHDLNNPFEFCDDHNSSAPKPDIVLNLRKWSELHPSREFRCFVKAKKTIAACQRDHRNYYPHLNEQKPQILQSILDFMEDIVVQKFSLENCNVLLTTSFVFVFNMFCFDSRVRCVCR
jgi:hypothetical protein